MINMRPIIIKLDDVDDLTKLKIYRTKNRQGYTILNKSDSTVIYKDGESDDKTFDPDNDKFGGDIYEFNDGYITENGLYLEYTNGELSLYDPLYNNSETFDGIIFGNDDQVKYNTYENNPLNYHFIKCKRDGRLLKPKANKLFSIDEDEYYEIDMITDGVNIEYDSFSFEYKQTFCIRSNVLISLSEEGPFTTNELVYDNFYEAEKNSSFKLYTNNTETVDIWVEVR